MSMDKVIERLSELEKKATKGPWISNEDGVSNKEYGLIALVYAEDKYRHRWYWECGTSNRDLIAESRSHLPILLRALKEMKGALEEMIKQDKKLGWDSNIAKSTLSEVEGLFKTKEQS